MKLRVVNHHSLLFAFTMDSNLLKDNDIVLCEFLCY